MLERHLNALMAVIIAAILWGALGIQFINHEEPCSLCFLQRLAMMCVAAGNLLNVKFGARKAHYGLSLLAIVFGGFVALRQIALHVCPQFPTFGTPFWGLSLYTWSFIVFVSSIAYIALLMLFFNKQDEKPKAPNWWGLFTLYFVFSAAFANIFASLWQCGLGPCK